VVLLPVIKAWVALPTVIEAFISLVVLECLLIEAQECLLKQAQEFLLLESQ